MDLPRFSRCLTRGTYHACKGIVVFVLVLAFLLAATFVFLRIHGIPGPVLREVLRRANAAGIPVEVDRIALTLNGWRADNVRYYSLHPDDLEPMFRSDHVFFSARNSKASNEASKGWNVDVRAEGLEMNPSVTWGVGIPPESGCRHVERLEVSLGFRSDRVVLSNGTMQWLGSRFAVNGTILKGERKKAEKPKHKQAALLPVFVDARQFQSLEEKLGLLSLPGGATVDIDFLVDMADYAASRVDFSIKAVQPGVNGVEFSEAEVSGNYTYPILRIERAGVSMGMDSCQMEGTYDFGSQQVKVFLASSLEEKELLRLFPQNVRDTLARIGLRIDRFPRFEIGFGPALAKELPNHLSGTFSIRNAAYRNLEIKSLSGRVKRAGNRLDFTELDSVVAGQEERAVPGGSALHGGFARGSAFFDGNSRAFGVDVDARLDPNILVGALSPIRVATNIIERFVFSDPPQGHVSAGLVFGTKDTFHIDIAAKGTNLNFQGVDFDTIDVVQTYRHGQVALDPLAATQADASSEGAMLIDLRKKEVAFDLATGLNPSDIEKLAYPGFNLFEKQIRLDGDIRIKGKGVFDWGSMQQTDFRIRLQADRVELAVAELGGFSAEILGHGPTISVENATFGFFGGQGKGSSSLAWTPGKKELPFKVEASFSKADFHRYLVFLGVDPASSFSGELSGNIDIGCDFSTNFSASAYGTGFVKVDHGQLADLPVFRGFSRVMRKVFPAFKVFPITGLRGNFAIAGGAVYSSDAYFEGDLVSAKGSGKYDFSTGYDATVQVQMLSESYLSKVVRAITDPLLKLFELRLTGSLSKPSWKLENF